MSSKTVLIVDDSRVSRMMIKRFVQEIEPDWSVIEGGDGDEALAVTEAADIDMMIIDYNMPGMDGLTLAEKLKQRFPLANATLLTANIQSAIENKAKDIGVGFEKKPITEEKIRGIISEGA